MDEERQSGLNHFDKYMYERCWDGRALVSNALGATIVPRSVLSTYSLNPPSYS